MESVRANVVDEEGRPAGFREGLSRQAFYPRERGLATGSRQRHHQAMTELVAIAGRRVSRDGADQGMPVVKAAGTRKRLLAAMEGEENSTVVDLH